LKQQLPEPITVDTKLFSKWRVCGCRIHAPCEHWPYKHGIRNDRLRSHGSDNGTPDGKHDEVDAALGVVIIKVAMRTQPGIESGRRYKQALSKKQEDR
jgi:hypothetical protein